MLWHKPLEGCRRLPGHMAIRGGMGLGDALYVQSIARHFVRQGQKVQVCSAWNDVFRTTGVAVSPFTRLGVDRVAHYTMRKHVKETTQFQDCCISAGIRGPVELKLDWTPTSNLVVRGKKPIVVVALPRTPMGRTDGFGAEILPDCAAVQKVIDAIRGQATIVQIGKGTPLYEFQGIDIDLANRTTVAEMIDVAAIADRFVGYCSFLIPLAESFSKRGLFIWSKKIRTAPHAFVRAITPQKVLHRATSRAVWDDEDVLEGLNGFL